MNDWNVGESYYETHLEAMNARAKYALATTHYIYHWDIDSKGSEATWETCYADHPSNADSSEHFRKTNRIYLANQ